MTSCGEARPPASGPALDDAPRYRTLIEQLPLVVYVDALDAESSNTFTSRQVEPLLASRSPSGLQTPACSCARSIPTIAIACSRRTRTVSASIGISVGGDVASMLQEADAAMYRAKAQPNGGYAFFEPDLDTLAAERSRRVRELRTAVAQQFTVEYQPVIDLEAHAITGYEALLRWQHPTDGKVAPLDFIPLAEDSGLIIPLGRWVLAEACRYGARAASAPRTAFHTRRAARPGRDGHRRQGSTRPRPSGRRPRERRRPMPPQRASARKELHAVRARLRAA